MVLMALGTAAACSLGDEPLAPVRLTTPPNGPVTPGDAVVLRPLVIATDANDFGLATWRQILDRAGSPYDVLLARNEPLDANRLVRPDGVGRYSAILLSSSALLFEVDPKAGPDGYHSALDPDEWEALWNYERTFGVRQAAINASPGTFPEDYCLRQRAEGALGGSPVSAELTDAGAAIFDQLRRDAPVPLADSYVYRSTVAPNCGAVPLLQLDQDVIGVTSTAPDGRERLAITMTMGMGQLSTDLLAFGLLRWATKGVFLGEQRYRFNVDVDDWFLPTMRRSPNGSTAPYRLSGPEAESLSRQQDDARDTYPLAGSFMLNLAFNGSGLDATAPAECEASGPADDLSSYSRCLARDFRWINHTFSHPEMNFTPYAEDRSQIADNLARAAAAGITVPANVLKTPEYSGLGVYRKDPADDQGINDHGLMESNKDLLKAASDLGIRYLHGNMSFAGHRPSCFNCGTYHPLQPDLFLVPDWPTNISFEAATPEEQTADYNGAYGSRGTTSKGPDLTYDQIVDAEAKVALQHISGGSIYSHTLHQGNLHEYAPGRSLTFDWINAVLAKYSAHFAVPLENVEWPQLGSYVEDRTAHFAELAAAHDAVWNRKANSLTYSPARSGPLFITGLATEPGDGPESDNGDQVERYGNDVVSRVGLRAGPPSRSACSPGPEPAPPERPSRQRRPDQMHQHLIRASLSEEEQTVGQLSGPAVPIPVEGAPHPLLQWDDRLEAGEPAQLRDVRAAPDDRSRRSGGRLDLWAGLGHPEHELRQVDDVRLRGVVTDVHDLTHGGGGGHQAQHRLDRVVDVAERRGTGRHPAPRTGPRRRSRATTSRGSRGRHPSAARTRCGTGRRPR